MKNGRSAPFQCNSPLIPTLLGRTVADAAGSAQMRVSSYVCSPQWWVNESTKRVWKHAVWPPALARSQPPCAHRRTDRARAQTHTYTYSQRAPCHVPTPVLAPLSVPDEHASSQPSLRKLVLQTGMMAKILRENYYYNKTKRTSSVLSRTHKHTEIAPKITGRNSLLDIPSDIFKNGWWTDINCIQACIFSLYFLHFLNKTAPLLFLIRTKT